MSLSRDYMIEENQRNNLSRLSRNINTNNIESESNNEGNNGARRPMKGRKSKKKKKKSFNRIEMVAVSPIPQNSSIHVINEEDEIENVVNQSGRNNRDSSE